MNLILFIVLIFYCHTTFSAHKSFTLFKKNILKKFIYYINWKNIKIILYCISSSIIHLYDIDRFNKPWFMNLIMFAPLIIDFIIILIELVLILCPFRLSKKILLESMVCYKYLYFFYSIYFKIKFDQ